MKRLVISVIISTFIILFFNSQRKNSNFIEVKTMENIEENKEDLVVKTIKNFKRTIQKKNEIYRDESIVSKDGGYSGYFGTVSHLKNEKTIDFSNEKEALKFYKNTTIKAYGSGSNYFRWNIKRNSTEFAKTLEKNLIRDEKNVFTKVSGEWKKIPISKNPIGTLKDVRVVERGQSGIAIGVYIRGSSGEYLYSNRYNVKKFLGGGNYQLYSGITGNLISSNRNVLPSSFLSIEKNQGFYHIYGGGFGHGVGMSQFAAKDLEKNYSKNYKEILNFFYPHTILEKIDDKNIVVGITNQHGSLEHEKIKLSSKDTITITTSGKIFNIPPNNIVTLTEKNRKISIYNNGNVVTHTNENISFQSKSEKIAINSIKKAHKKVSHPEYGGIINVRMSNSGNLNILNEVSLETYLRGVIPSEMSQSGGIEALKAQAITARTYALKTMQGNNMKKYGFHLTDTPRYQVYNWKDETQMSEMAVRDTKGMILMSGNKYADTQYYSTSAGIGIIAEHY